ncbi:MAG: Mrp/NBP35 family ATP-binding protein [Oscillospiraceae bacterium]|nr:Mrp/NBP35 family ATP-binding protein [Oscillospiraceae bacterium]
MSECTHNCSTCGANCSSRNEPQSLIEPLNAQSSVKKVIGVVSGKGGVGKSLVTGMLATLFAKKGFKTAIMDADITGPSIPKMFGIDGRAKGTQEGILPAETSTGIEIMSVNLLLENPSDPVIWRGPVIAGVVKQFWTDVIWGDVDYMFVDMPPGTGDVPLTVFQSIPLDAIVIVASPQDLVAMIVNKAVSMADMMNIPIIGVVENMSYVECPDCGKKIYLYGESHIDKVCEEKHIPLLAQIPISPTITACCDSGRMEDADCSYLEYAVKAISNLPDKN